jgi:Domain of unknown function (DUF1338)
MKPAELAKQLWDSLWQDYRDRVNYARTYQQMIENAGGTIANDHIAFRTLRLTTTQNGSSLQLGIPYLANIVEAFGYQAAGEYHFPDQLLYARHYAHPEQSVHDLPKLFISELKVDELPKPIGTLIQQTVASGAFAKHADLPSQITAITSQKNQENHQSQKDLLSALRQVFQRPWLPAKQSIVEAVNQASQYGAWVLLHGYAVNHFTGYVNRHQTEQYKTIEQTVAGLIHLGVPMKPQLEGSQESGLCQTATQAVMEPVWVQEDATGELIQIPWPYAYYEIAERYPLETPSGQSVLFEGFLNAQAKQLFEMTRRS